MMRTLSKSDFMPLAKNVFDDIIDHSVAFIKQSPNDPDDFDLGGSGTLV
jgi:hypothetical protein